MAIYTESVSSTLVFGGSLSHSVPVDYCEVELQTRDAIVDQVVYELKRTRPSRLDLYKIAYHTVDLETGQKIVGTSRVRIDRAVVLPSQLESKFTFDLAYLAASRDFTEGGFYSTRLCTIVIDANDIPKDWGTPNPEQWVITDDVRWNIIKVINLGWRSWALTVQQTVGEDTVRGDDANNNLVLTQTVEVA